MAAIKDHSLLEQQAQFALDLLRSVATKPHEDVVVSPVSIAVGLAMTYLGAAGETKKQMNDVLFPGFSDEEVHGYFSTLVDRLNQTENAYQLHTANRLYVQHDYQLLGAFVDQLAKLYQSELLAVDFKTQAPAIAAQVNTWVAGVTMGKIADVIAPNALKDTTRLMLVNAIYFKGDWLHPFRPFLTRQRPFYTADGREKTVQMMQQTPYNAHIYAEHTDCQVLGMPYKDHGQLLMYFILPKERYGLVEMEAALTGDRLLELISETAVNNTSLKIELPKFKLEKTIDLKEALSGLGMKDMFIPLVADFTNITSDLESGVKEPLYMSSIMHKAFIAVNEKGTEAAAATAYGLLGGARGPVTSFIADHPFLFAIVDGGGRLFFVGRVGGGSFP